MTDTHTTPAPTVATKRKLPATRLMPKPGALDAAYRRYAQGGIRIFTERGKPRKRGEHYKTKDELMLAIGQKSASAWGHLNKARNALDIESAIQLAEEMETTVETIFEIHEEAERHLNKLRREEWRRKHDAWKQKWTATMKAFPLPLTKSTPLDVADWIVAADRIEFAKLDGEFNRLDLSTAQIVDELPKRIERAKTLGRYTAGKEIEDFLVELSATADWVLLAGRYVERECLSDEPDDYGNLDVPARKILVLKLSTLPEDPDFTVDRSSEYDGESNAEEACERQDYRAFEDLAAWTAPYRFWEEVRR